MTVALLCSGQGTQHREMFRLTADLPAAAGIFSAAREALGCDPRTFVLTASEASLHANRTAQILCVTQALAAQNDHSALTRRAIVVGYSVGESPLGDSRPLDPAGHCRTSPGFAPKSWTRASGTNDGLGFLRGLSHERVAALGSQHGVEIAIVNPATPSSSADRAYPCWPFRGGATPCTRAGLCQFLSRRTITPRRGRCPISRRDRRA